MSWNLVREETLSLIEDLYCIDQRLEFFTYLSKQQYYSLLSIFSANTMFFSVTFHIALRFLVETYFYQVVCYFFFWIDAWAQCLISILLVQVGKRLILTMNFSALFSMVSLSLKKNILTFLFYFPLSIIIKQLISKDSAYFIKYEIFHIIHSCRFELHQRLDKLFSSFLQPWVCYIHPFLSSCSFLLYSWLDRRGQELFFGLPFVQRIVDLLLFQFIFSVSFLEFVFLAHP